MRTWHFFASGAVGGLAGFALMEAITALMGADGTASSTLMRAALYFSGFGLAVGAALGMTEGLVRRKRGRLWYGLTLGLILGGAGGFAGGWLGQAVFGLVPIRYATRADVDIAIALDSSGSMRQLLVFGSDPSGHRRTAASRLVDRLSSAERVAVIDFDDGARVLCPLTALTGPAERDRVKAAIDRIDDVGGTNLDAGLEAAIDELGQHRVAGRPQHVIFLTDGAGAYSDATAEAARAAGIVIHTIGLGDSVEADLLRRIASTTGGRYIPVADASDLSTVFQSVFEEEIAVTEARQGPGATGAELLTNPWLIRIARTFGWALIGLAIGLGQGVRENTREDLRACAIGGLIGGTLGGLAFDPIANAMTIHAMTFNSMTIGAGLAGRAAGDLIVGACIGGSMRAVQHAMVERSNAPTTTLLRILPTKEQPTAAVLRPAARAPAQSPATAPVLRTTASRTTASRTTASRTTAPAQAADAHVHSARPGSAPPAAPPPPVDPPHRDPSPLAAEPRASAVLPTSERAPARPPSPPREPSASSPSIASFEALHDDREIAMAAAFHCGGHRLRAIADHFGVGLAAARRAVQQHASKVRS